MFTNGTMNLQKQVISDREILQKYNLYHTYELVENINKTMSLQTKCKPEELFK